VRSMILSRLAAGILRVAVSVAVPASALKRTWRDRGYLHQCCQCTNCSQNRLRQRYGRCQSGPNQRRRDFVA